MIHPAELDARARAAQRKVSEQARVDVAKVLWTAGIGSTRNTDRVCTRFQPVREAVSSDRMKVSLACIPLSLLTGLSFSESACSISR
jgi:hypothetical protein